ncbi:hypothetical protein N499_0671 [Wolbachia pipientis wVitA]|nr:hypothetical protein N499_0671 [Wolbachia pipientis wVitA]
MLLTTAAFLPTNLLNRVDFPAFGRPTMAIFSIIQGHVLYEVNYNRNFSI